MSCRRTPLPPGHQPDWRWCRKCDGLAYDGQPSVCPAGGAHDHTGSGAYALADEHARGRGPAELALVLQMHEPRLRRRPGRRDARGAGAAGRDPRTRWSTGLSFEAASGPERFHLPRYRLARRVVDGSEQYLIRMSKRRGRPVVARGYARQAPPRRDCRRTRWSSNTTILLQPHLRADHVRAAARRPRRSTFTEVGETADGGQVVARMHFASPAERGPGAVGDHHQRLGLRRRRAAVGAGGGPDRRTGGPLPSGDPRTRADRRARSRCSCTRRCIPTSTTARRPSPAGRLASSRGSC